MSLASELRSRAKVVDKPEHRVLVLDIENGPNIAAVWGLWDQNISTDMIHESSSVICFAAKWQGTDEVFFFSDYHDGHDLMVAAAWELLNEATAVIHYNGDAHDIKHLNREFLLAGLRPPSPYKNIDLLKIIRQRFKFPSNKLDYVAQRLGVGKKVKHPGYTMWKDAIYGTPEEKAAAWALFRVYNIGDIYLTDDVYVEVRPWINSHPVIHVAQDIEVPTCYGCGSTNISDEGVDIVGSYIYPRYLCGGCNSWMRGTTNLGKIANTKLTK
jgi:hypothetical protein